MSMTADQIVDRRRLRRKLTFWRVFAVLLAICAVIALGTALHAPGTAMLTGQPGASIARVTWCSLSFSPVRLANRCPLPRNSTSGVLPKKPVTRTRSEMW